MVSLRLPFGKGARARDERRRALLRGDDVELTARLRRTSARGWGPWTDVDLYLGPIPDGQAWWHAEDPVAVGLASTRGPVDVSFAEVNEIWRRPVRFQTEAFWGMEADIVVVIAERSTTELALSPDLSAGVEDRLRDLFGLDGGVGLDPDTR